MFHHDIRTSIQLMRRDLFYPKITFGMNIYHPKLQNRINVIRKLLILVFNDMRKHEETVFVICVSLFCIPTKKIALQTFQKIEV